MVLPPAFCALEVTRVLQTAVGVRLNNPGRVLRSEQYSDVASRTSRSSCPLRCRRLAIAPRLHSGSGWPIPERDGISGWLQPEHASLRTFSSSLHAIWILPRGAVGRICGSGIWSIRRTPPLESSSRCRSPSETIHTKSSAFRRCRLRHRSHSYDFGRLRIHPGRRPLKIPPGSDGRSSFAELFLCRYLVHVLVEIEARTSDLSSRLTPRSQKNELGEVVREKTPWLRRGQSRVAQLRTSAVKFLRYGGIFLLPASSSPVSQDQYLFGRTDLPNGDTILLLNAC